MKQNKNEKEKFYLHLKKKWKRKKKGQQKQLTRLIYCQLKEKLHPHNSRLIYIVQIIRNATSQRRIWVDFSRSRNAFDRLLLFSFFSALSISLRFIIILFYFSLCQPSIRLNVRYVMFWSTSSSLAANDGLFLFFFLSFDLIAYISPNRQNHTSKHNLSDTNQ